MLYKCIQPPKSSRVSAAKERSAVHQQSNKFEFFRTKLPRPPAS